MPQLEFGELNVDVTLKNIKNIHLSVYPPTGVVKVSAPENMSIDTIRVFLVSKIGWIKKQQNKFVEQEREAPRDYIDRESHYFSGRRYLMKVVEHNAPPRVDLSHKIITLFVRTGTSTEKRQIILNEWYRDQLKQQIPEIIQKYEKIMGVKVTEFGVKRMKTKWGTCNSNAGRIWLNLELAKKPPQCLEYIVVHEMVHLLERTHNDRFVAFMDMYMPQWRFHKDELNRLPVRHENWSY